MSTQLEILAKFTEAKRKMDALPPMKSEIRMHPDDIEELRRRVRSATLPGPFNGWVFGIKIIPDESAERLPRLPRTEP